ncbi:hypothetical protein PMAYCL1PPCAC_25647, partial [Pristionchus mayeri]
RMNRRFPPNCTVHSSLQIQLAKVSLEAMRSSTYLYRFCIWVGLMVGTFFSEYVFTPFISINLLRTYRVMGIPYSSFNSSII